jgi:hypothetical protein
MLRASFAEWAGRLTFEIGDEKIPSGPEYLTEMIIPMTSNPERRGLQLEKCLESILYSKLIVQYSSSLLLRERRQIVESTP